MNSIEKLFQENLNDKFAFISSGGLNLEGTIEEKCKLDFIEYSGIHCSVKLKNNQSEILKKIEQIIIDNRSNLNLSYDDRDKLIDTIIEPLKDSYVHVGKISPYGIKEIITLYNDDKITSISIKYLKGSIIEIRNINEK